MAEANNSSITRSFSIAFIFIIAGLLIINLVLLPIPAQAGVPDATILSWATINTPGKVPDKNDLHTPCELNSLVAGSDGKTIYAIDVPDAVAAPIARPGLWKSIDGGIIWNSMPFQRLVEATPTPTLPMMDIALAPDDPALLVVVCLNSAATLRHEVYLSDDGGSSWTHTGFIPWVYGGGEQIGDVAISPGYNFNGRLTHDIVVGSRNPDDGNGEGEVYVLRYPDFSGWKAQGSVTGDIIAVKPSPTYTDDFTLVVMAATTDRTYICLGYRDIAANTCVWNTDTGWPVEMCVPDQCGGNTSGEDRIISGNVALPSDFVGTSGEQRIIFTAYDSNGTAQGASQLLDDVYRLNDTMVTKLRLPEYGSSTRISSIAYTGSVETGKLLAGEVAADSVRAASKVWTCYDPLSSCPTWKLSLKPPTGGGGTGYANVQLAWTSAGSKAFAATGSGNRNTPQKWANPTSAAWNGQNLDESAMSITEDDGESWNQIGLIDTRIDRFRDVAASKDESTLYLASVNDSGLDSLWRSQSPVLGEVWQRVMCYGGESPIVRLSPENNDGASIFWGNQGTVQARRSTNHGQIWYDCLPNVIIQDMAASSSKGLYILQADGQVRRGTYTTGWRWTKSTDSGLNAAHTITIQGDNIMVGAASTESFPVAYSADGGSIWSKIIKETPSAGNKHVAFDIDFEKNKIIYVADDSGGMYRWTIGNSISWDDLSPPNHSFYGIAIGSGGAVYGAHYSPDETGVDRSLYTRSGIPKPGVYWDFLTTGLSGGIQFSTEPSSITISQASLWAIDARDYNPINNQGCLWAFTDSLAMARPSLIEPGDIATFGCDPVSGRNQEVDLKWEQLSLADAYEIQIAKSKDFTLRITEAEPLNNPFYYPDKVTVPAYRVVSGILPEAGHSYFWRVRVRQAATGQVIRSRWAEKRSFIIKTGFPVVSPYIGAQALKPCHCACGISPSSVAFSWTAFKEATEYKFTLATDSALKDILVVEFVPTSAFKYNGKLGYGTDYFWQVTATEPAPSDPSPVFSFTTEDKPALSQPLPSLPLSLTQIKHWLLAIFLTNILGDIFILVTIVLLVSRYGT